MTDLNLDLERRLRHALTPYGLRIWRHEYPLLDLMWGQSTEWVLNSSGSIVIDGTTSERRLQAHVVEAEIRYWIATHTDPAALQSIAKGELGVVESADDLAALCIEFLTSDLLPDQLTTRRRIGSSM